MRCWSSRSSTDNCATQKIRGASLCQCEFNFSLNIKASLWINMKYSSSTNGSFWEERPLGDRPAMFLYLYVDNWKSKIRISWVGRLTITRGWRVGFFNFGSGRVQVLEKIIGSGLGSGSGIGNIYWIKRVLSGIENLNWVFPYFVIDNSWSTWLDIKFGIS